MLASTDKPWCGVSLGGSCHCNHLPSPSEERCCLFGQNGSLRCRVPVCLSSFAWAVYSHALQECMQALLQIHSSSVNLIQLS